MDRADRPYWLASAAASVLLAALLAWSWYAISHRMIDGLKNSPGQLESREAVEQYLRERYPSGDIGGMHRIPTGIYIQTLDFSDDVDVRFTGYIWQVYPDGVPEEYRPVDGEPGFILPDQVNAGLSLKPRLDYRLRRDDGDLFGWYVEATLRQPFEYDLFPFDHKVVSVRIWQRDFVTDVVSVPDFAAYGATGTRDIFGIKEDIVIPRWTRENTFFDYRSSTYPTNFGIADFEIGIGFPELHYNFVLKRNLLEALTEYMLILAVIALLLFVTLLIISERPGQAKAHGFDTATIIGACSALFFVAILSHIELRERFPGTPIVFLEYFFYLLYVALVLATANAYLFSLRERPSLKVVHYRDNLLPKVLYWPFLLGASLLVTLAVL